MIPAEAWRGYKPESFARLALEEGDAVLDLGCGTGEDARTLAQLVRGVSVVGVDKSAVTIAEAQRLTLGIPRPVEFRVGDAHYLDLDSGTFDACRADKVFHHLDDPAKALGELVRVARPDGRIVVSDADYDTLVVDAPDRVLTRRILDAFRDHLPHGRIGRRLRAMLVDVGLAAVDVTAYTAIVTQYVEDVVRLREKAEDAARTGVVSADEAARWMESVEAADRAGRFFCALTLFTVSGRKP